MNILFLCVGNSARSQIAEALAKSMLPNSFDIRSAGSDPAQEVHKDAIETMKDFGIDISLNKTKHIEQIDEGFISSVDYVITLCAEEVCPAVPNSTKLIHWPNEDPDNNKYNHLQSKNAFNKTRDNIYNLLKKFMLDNL